MHPGMIRHAAKEA
ncbi:hypothetical protein RUM_07750 [Ruminococcus champanellensis 18P13 = JCM 17042]|uniref:Uncharacterized protein n=1 Tax=Ruminococcus champanellensis (strain DSM 18848 / JCM 17042 / KCTC 15320 / 18P13) TaxID=213810 RepID=D4LBH2_RUMC1|nr:hypothetical protein RUM_07750 [Ruminococcus champanellensis 18P13 = JCM 17042]